MKDYYSYNVNKRIEATALAKFTKNSICSSDKSIVVMGVFRKNISSVSVSNDVIVVMDGYGKNLYFENKRIQSMVAKSTLETTVSPIMMNDMVFKVNDGTLSLSVGKTSYGDFGDIIDDVAYIDTTDNACAIILLKDGTVWTMGNGSKGTIGNGKNARNVYPHLLMSLVKTENENTPMKIEIVSTKLYEETYDLKIQFYNENNELIQPVGLVNVKITNDEGVVFDKELYITGGKYTDSGFVILELQKIDFDTNYTGSGIASLNFIKSNVNVTVEGEVRNIPHKTGGGYSPPTASSSNSYPSSSGSSSSSSSSSNSSMYNYYNGLVESYRAELSNVMQERNVRVYEGGRWTYTYDRNRATQIQKEIDYYTAMRDMYR